MIKHTLVAVALAASGTTMASTTISFWHAMSGQLGETVNKIASDFNASQQTCHLDPIYKGNYEENMTAGIAAFRARKSPNIIQIFDAGAATIINAKGAVVPVEDLLKNNGVAFNKQDYLQGVRNFYADSHGKMIGMPFNSSTVIMYYNEDALKKAGVKPPKTWEDFEKIAPKLKEAGYIGFSQSHTPWIFSENFHSRHNLQLADKHNGFEGPARKVMYNNPHMIMHFKKLKEWKDKGYYGYYGSNWGENQTPFEKGEVAIWLGSSGDFGAIKQKVQFPFSATYLPYWDSLTKGKDYHTFIGGAALFAFVGKSDAENQCTAQFFKYLGSTDVQTFWHKQTGYVPITNAAYDKVKADGYYKEFPAAEVGILQLNKEEGEWTKGYRLGFYPQIREVLYREYDKLFNGSITVEDAFKTIEQESDKLLDRFAKTVK